MAELYQWHLLSSNWACMAAQTCWDVSQNVAVRYAHALVHPETEVAVTCFLFSGRHTGCAAAAAVAVLSCKCEWGT